MSAPSHPRQPTLTSLEALSLLPGDHPGGGRVAGCRVVIPGVTQAMPILAGVVPATREHTGCQDSRAGHAQSTMSQPWSILSGSSANDTRPLGEPQCPLCPGSAGILPAPSFGISQCGERVRNTGMSVGCSQQPSLFFPAYGTAQPSWHHQQPSGPFSV